MVLTGREKKRPGCLRGVFAMEQEGIFIMNGKLLALLRKNVLMVCSVFNKRFPEFTRVYLLVVFSFFLSVEAVQAQEVVEVKAARSLADKIANSGVIIFISLILFFLLRIGLKKLERVISDKDAIRESETTLQIKTFVKLFSWLGTVVLAAIAIYMVLANFGFDVAPLLAGAGIIGLAFGFGGQYLIRDLINGFFILLEGQYRVNDVVQIGDFSGLVESINLRTTTLRDLEGRVIIIPNGEVKTVINHTKEFAYALFDIGVAYKENVDRVMDVIKELGGQMSRDSYFGRLILEGLEMLGVDGFAESHVSIKFRIKTIPIRQWEVAREFRRRLKNRFDELGIEFPFPHRTLYWGAGKDNDWMKQFASLEYFKK